MARLYGLAHNLKLAFKGGFTDMFWAVWEDKEEQKVGGDSGQRDEVVVLLRVERVDDDEDDDGRVNACK